MVRTMIMSMLMIMTIIMIVAMFMMMTMMMIMTMVRGGNMTRGEEGLSSCFVTAERASVGHQEASSSSLSS